VSTLPAHIHAARQLVAGALSVPLGRIGPETKMYDLPVWDSLGQLSVVLAIEEELHLQIADASVFNSLTSVAGIAAYLAGVATDER
jgi:acyl carrier protein